MKNYPACLALACAALLCIASCKKSSSNANAYSITLAAPVQNGNFVTLTWSKLNNPSLIGYEVVRVPDTLGNAYSYKFTVGKDTTQFTDTLLSMPYVQYYVIGYTTTVSYTSNKVVYARNDISLMHLFPQGAVIDNTTRLLYVTGQASNSTNGAIGVYDLQRKKADTTITLGIPYIGSCDLGSYNGNRELYVPGGDGNLYIYNTATWALIGSISVGSALTGVVNSNGILYVTGQSNFVDYTFVYNRASESLITKQSTEFGITLQLIPGTNSDFIGIDEVNKDYFYKYDNNGNFLYVKTGGVGTSGNVGPYAVSPAGNLFASCSTGIIANDSLVQVGSLPRSANQYFGSYCFDTTHQIVYAAQNNSIAGYSLSGYSLVTTLYPLGVPGVILYYNGSLLSVSYYNYNPTYSGVNETYTFIEQP